MGSLIYEYDLVHELKTELCYVMKLFRIYLAFVNSLQYCVSRFEVTTVFLLFNNFNPY